MLKIQCLVCNIINTRTNNSDVFFKNFYLEFVSRLANNQQTSTTPSTNASNGQFLFASSFPVHVPSSTTTPAELARLQQQIENGESMIQIKYIQVIITILLMKIFRTTLLNAKQKRSSQNQQQQQASSTQPVIFTHPSGYDYQLWQQHFPALQPAYNNLNFLPGILPNDTTTGNSNIITSLSKHSQQSYREYDPRSLLGK